MIHFLHLIKPGSQAFITEEIKTNRYEPSTGILTFTPFQTETFHALQDYYTQLFISGDERMGIQPEIVKTAGEGFRLTGFFSWLAWAASPICFFTAPSVSRCFTWQDSCMVTEVISLMPNTGAGG